MFSHEDIEAGVHVPAHARENHRRLLKEEDWRDRKSGRERGKQEVL